ncbi:MAG TPA: hypothetical protein VLA89_08750 [Gemmatimonadales bacterium]|nr:hypothetical protein [Gemmatimonadales bacterium]
MSNDVEALERLRSPDAYLFHDPESGEELWLATEDVDRVWVDEELL